MIREDTMEAARKSPTRKEWHHGVGILLLMLITVFTLVSAAELLDIREDVESIEAAVQSIEATEKARIEQAARRRSIEAAVQSIEATEKARIEQAARRRHFESSR